MRWTHYFAAVGLLGAVACGSDNDNDNGDFENVVPSAQALSVQAPTGRNQALTAVAGAQSAYYVDTLKATRAVNGTVAGVLGLVALIADQPPTSIDGDTATWGPGDGDALDANVYRLIATARGNDVYDYHFDYRAKADANGDFIVLLEGTHDTSDGGDGKGSVTMHVDDFARANGDDCSRGDVIADYDTTTQPQTLAVAFQGFRDCAENDTQFNATYYYDRSADGSGNFEFATNGDIQEGARQPVVNEDLVIRSRWNGTGAGRSDGRISGGDLALEGVSEVTASECWDASFDLTFAVTTPQIVDPAHVAGAVSACPPNMQEASFAVEASVSVVAR
jgi:hypothetical protein